MSFNDKIGLAKGANGSLSFTQQGVVAPHYHLFANGELNRFQPNYQLRALFVYSCFLRAEVGSDLGKQLVKPPLCFQPFCNSFLFRS
jgi:hypothetical protein